eukprot:4618681-Prorocentrum_lima.AAC.1
MGATSRRRRRVFTPSPPHFSGKGSQQPFSIGHSCVRQPVPAFADLCIIRFQGRLVLQDGTDTVHSQAATHP